jgi:hypothetical protein
VSWTGLQVPTKQARTKEEARKLIDEIWSKYRANSSQANWAALQKLHNEDSLPHSSYDSTQSLIPEFKATAGSTGIGSARIVESRFGFHLIRREA